MAFGVEMPFPSPHEYGERTGDKPRSGAGDRVRGCSSIEHKRHTAPHPVASASLRARPLPSLRGEGEEKLFQKPYAIALPPAGRGTAPKAWWWGLLQFRNSILLKSAPIASKTPTTNAQERVGPPPRLRGGTRDASRSRLRALLDKGHLGEQLAFFTARIVRQLRRQVHQHGFAFVERIGHPLRQGGGLR